MNMPVTDCLKLGFGLMRLPRKGTSIDIAETERMVDRFLSAGGKYFDTAFVYEGSEEAAGKALCSRYPRDSYYLASKLNANAFACKNAEEARKEIETSLERSGAGYFDFYLLHALDKDNKAIYESYGAWDYVRDLKERGLIRHYGFSFHDSPELLDRLLTEHPDAEFVQLQINYADWEHPGVASRRCYETAVAHNTPIVVMEPVKGGTLASLPDSVRDVFVKADPDAPLSAWALRFAASLPGVMMVLSGMSNLEQMEENLRVFSPLRPLSASEQETVAQAREALSGLDHIDCTACHYCTTGCPQNIRIPGIFSALNMEKMFGQPERAKTSYGFSTHDTKASDCIGCGQCEDACPQHLPIISLLQEAAEKYE